MIVPFPPGGQIDIIGRLIGHWLSGRLGQQFFVDNRPGAAGNIGTEAAVRAAADGHMLLLASVTNASQRDIVRSSTDFIRDTAPVASINRIPLVLECPTLFQQIGAS
jgi:tripartite-type tricarboxylate transporter receptor subunit TctC